MKEVFTKEMYEQFIKCYDEDDYSSIVIETPMGTMLVEYVERTNGCVFGWKKKVKTKDGELDVVFLANEIGVENYERSGYGWILSCYLKFLFGEEMDKWESIISSCTTVFLEKTNEHWLGSYKNGCWIEPIIDNKKDHFFIEPYVGNDKLIAIDIGI